MDIIKDTKGRDAPSFRVYEAKCWAKNENHSDTLQVNKLQNDGTLVLVELCAVSGQIFHAELSKWLDAGGSCGAIFRILDSIANVMLV